MTAWFFAAVRMATPLYLAGLGGLFSERSGKANIALEGFMLSGAFACVMGCVLFRSPWIGLMAGGLGGLLLAALHCTAVIRFKVNALLSGVVMNLLAAASTDFLFLTAGDLGGDRLSVSSTKTIHALSLLCLILAASSHFFFSRTVHGLRWRTVGQSPAGARSLGIGAASYQSLGILVSGFLSGLAGSFLALQAGQFVRGMSAGRGFLALAALILSNWRPLRLVAVCFTLGGLSALSMRVEVLSLPSQLLEAVPYLITLLVMAGLALKSEPPAGLSEEEDMA